MPNRNDGSEQSSDLNVNIYETLYRSYDAQIGRFQQVDPMGDSYVDWSHYNFAFNNPILLNDPTGGSPGYDENGSSFDNWLYEQYANAGMLDVYYQMMGWQQQITQQAQNNYNQNMAIIQYLWNVTPNGVHATYNNTPGSNGTITGFYYDNTDGFGQFVTKNYHGETVSDDGATYAYAGYVGAVDFFQVAEGKTFPTFAKLLENYPKPYSAAPYPRETYYNQCAIRLSIALIKSGVDLKGVKNLTNPGGTTCTKKGEVLGAYNLANYLKGASVLGKPEVFVGTKQNIPTLLNGRTGIIYFESFVEDGVRTSEARHIDLWNKDYIQATDYFDQMMDSKVIWFWPVK